MEEITKPKPDVSNMDDKEILTELEGIDNELESLVEIAPFYQRKIENLIARRNLLDDVLLEREAKE